MTKQIQRPDTGTLLTDHFRLSSRVAPELDEIVTPTVTVADLTKGSTPPICRSAAAQFSQGVVAAERAVWRLEAPPGVILKVTSFWLSNIDATSDCNVHFGSSFAVVPSVASVSRFTDGRLTGAELPGGLLLHDTQVAALAAFEWRRLLDPLEEINFTPPNWIVGTGLPGSFGFIEFGMGSLITGVNVSLEWDEFQLV